MEVNSNLKAGQNILIPNLNFAESQITDNEVYNNPDEKDNYGKDIKIKNQDLSIIRRDGRSPGSCRRVPVRGH